MVGFLQDPPVLETAIGGLVVRPCHQLHPEILFWVAVIIGALDFDGVPLWPLSALVRLSGCRQFTGMFMKILMSIHAPAGYGPLIQTRFPARILIPSSYWSTDLPAYLRGPKRFPFFVTPFCRIQKSVPSIVIRQSFWTLLTRRLSKSICGSG